MALSAGRKIEERLGRDLSYPVAAGVQIWQGGLVMLDTGVAKPAATGGNSTIASHYVVVGIADASVLGGAADGAVRVPLRRGWFKFKNSGGGDAIVLSNVGAPCYAVDDQTVALTSNTNVRAKAGTIEDVESDGVWVSVGA